MIAVALRGAIALAMVVARVGQAAEPIQLRPLYRLANMAHHGTDHNEPGAEQRHAGESPSVPQHLVPLSVPRPLEAFGDGEWPEKEQEPLPENTLLTGHRHFRRTHIKHGGRKRRRRTKAVIP